MGAGSSSQYAASGGAEAAGFHSSVFSFLAANGKMIAALAVASVLIVASVAIPTVIVTQSDNNAAAAANHSGDMADGRLAIPLTSAETTSAIATSATALADEAEALTSKATEEATTTTIAPTEATSALKATTAVITTTEAGTTTAATTTTTTTVAITTATTTTERPTFPPRVSDAVHYDYEWTNLTWSVAKDFCEQRGRSLCTAAEICVDSEPVITGVYWGEDRWAPTNDIANSWVQVGQDVYTLACWEHTYAKGVFPSWGQNTDSPELKKDIYCCTAETHDFTFCKQVDRVFLVQSDFPHRTDRYFPGENWTLPSGIWCRCADDGYSECTDPDNCFGGFTPGQVFCSGMNQPFAQQCTFPIEEDRQPPGKYVSLGDVHTHYNEECAACNETGCMIWVAQWGEWGEWGACSADCGTGMRRRFRSCQDGNLCFGDDNEHGSCTIQACPDQDVPPNTWSEEMLTDHNYYRRGHGANQLTWDSALATTAQKYVDYLVSINATTVVHSSQGWYPNGEVYRLYGVSEMMAYTTKTNKVAPEVYLEGSRGARGYYSEVVYYDWDNPGQTLPAFSSNVIGHFTQLLWNSTQKIGCGLARSELPISNGKYVYMSACHYFPGGNVAVATWQWQAEVPSYVEGLICEVECGANKCWSFTGLKTDGVTSSSCQCDDTSTPSCTTPCFVFCPGVDWAESCHGQTECHCTYKSAVCDGFPIVT